MKFTTTVFSFAALATLIILVICGYGCVRRDCANFSLKETRDIQFHLKNKITGGEILTYTGTVMAAPDSIKLKNLKTGNFYQLSTASGGNNIVQLYSQLYNRPAGIVDSLVFYFGNAIPDTLVVYTSIVKGLRGDECPAGKDAGINKVTLRGQVLVETTYDNPVITLLK